MGKCVSNGNVGVLQWLSYTGRVNSGELAPHPETAAQTHGRRQPFETGV